MPACCNFEVACSFLGWGDPGHPDHRAVWFVGIEGGGAPWTQENLEHVKGRYFTSWNDVNANAPADPGPLGQVEQWISKICCGVSAAYGGDWRDNWNAYRIQVLRQPNSRVFLTNARSLWRPRQNDWPAIYEELFGLAHDGLAYIEATRARRYPQIRKRRALSHPQATICFGAALWPEFRCLFELDELPAQDRVCAYAAEQILLIPFLGQAGPEGPMSNTLAEHIIGQLRGWNVALP